MQLAFSQLPVPLTKVQHFCSLPPSITTVNTSLGTSHACKSPKKFHVLRSLTPSCKKTTIPKQWIECWSPASCIYYQKIWNLNTGRLSSVSDQYAKLQFALTRAHCETIILLYFNHSRHTAGLYQYEPWLYGGRKSNNTWSNQWTNLRSK